MAGLKFAGYRLPLGVMQSNESNLPLTLDYPAEHRSGRWRTRLATVLAIVGGLSAGYALTFAGYGFFGCWMLFTFACPIVICLIAVSRHLLLSMLCTGAMMGVLLFRAFVPATFGLSLLPEQHRSFFITTAVLTLFSLLIAGCIGAVVEARDRKK
jgi:hypothetical protein